MHRYISKNCLFDAVRAYIKRNPHILLYLLWFGNYLMRYKSRNTLYSGTCSRIVQHNAKRFLMLGTYLEFVSPPSSSSLCPSCYNYAVRHSQIIHTLYHIRATGKAIHTISISCTVPVYIPFLFFIPSRVSLSLSLSHTHTHVLPL